MNESQWVQLLREFSGAHPRVGVGIGDDAAVVRTAGDLVATTDLLADGVHFDVERDGPARVGHKALDVSRLAAASGCGAALEMDAIPIADAARRAALESGRTPLAHRETGDLLEE